MHQLRYVALAIMLAAFLSACGADDTPSAKAEPTATPTQSARQSTAALAADQASPTVTVTQTASPTPQPISPTQSAPNLTLTSPTRALDLPMLEEIYAQAAASMTQSGMLFHMTQTATSDAGTYSYNGSMEWWVDTERNLVHRNMTRTLGPFEADDQTQTTQFDGTTIMIDGAARTLTTSPESSLQTTPAQRCYLASEAVSAVLGCPGPTEDSTTTVERAEYLGQPVIALVKIGTSRGSDEQSTFTERLYLDAETALPIAREINGSLNAGETTPFSILIDYQYEFIPADSVPADFFDPLSLVTTRLDSLQTESPIYWLGLRFDPEGDFPPLTITDGGPPDHPDPPFEALVTYHLTGDQPTQFAPSIVLQQWSHQAWESGPATGVQTVWAEQPCHEITELDLPAGHAIIFLSQASSTNPMPTSLGYNLPTPPTDGTCLASTYTRIEAIIEFEETVIFLYIYNTTIPPNIDVPEPTPNPYLTKEGIEALVQGLKPMESQAK